MIQETQIENDTKRFVDENVAIIGNLLEYKYNTKKEHKNF